MSPETIKVLEELGNWFEFSVYDHDGQTYIKGRQWYKWDGKVWKHILASRLPEALKE